MSPRTRTVLGAAVVAAAWGCGEVIDAATGVLPGPVAGLLVLAAVLLARPGLQEAVAPVAAAMIRVLPLLFVPAVVAVAGVDGDVHVAALVVGVLASLPIGFAVAARIAR